MKQIYKYIIVALVGIIVGLCVAYTIMPTKVERVEIPTPVEKIMVKDHYITRDSIIYKVKYIEKIQHDTIEKVYALDADGTLDLFYQLVSE